MESELKILIVRHKDAFLYDLRHALRKHDKCHISCISACVRILPLAWATVKFAHHLIKKNDF